MVADLPITVYQGDTYRRQFTVDGINVSAWTFLAQIRAGTADNMPVAAQFTASVVDGPAGVFELALAPADSAVLDPSVVHWWDVQATVDNGDIHTLFSSEVTVRAEYSRPVVP